MRVINNYRMDSNEGGEGSSITSKRRRHRRSCLLACFACLQTSLQEDDDDDDDERDRRATSCRAIYFPISLPASSKPSVKQAALYSFDQHVIKRHKPLPPFYLGSCHFDGG